MKALHYDEVLAQNKAQSAANQKKYAGIYNMRLNSAMSLDFFDARDQIHETLLKRKEKVATMESCTAGAIATLLTENSGASAYFTHGYITYSIGAKQDAGVDNEIIDKHGVYSSECATAMAEAIAADYGIGITGVAGPKADGEVAAGTVWIAVTGHDEAAVQKYKFDGDRMQVRKFAAMRAVVDFALFLDKLNGEAKD